MRIYAVLVIAACSNAAPVPQPVPAPAKAEEPAATPMLDPSTDLWANTRQDPYAVQAAQAKQIPFATPVIMGPARTELAIDPTPGKRVAAVSGTIDLLAVTHDGGAAVTADSTHSIRLWPTLDGKREPLVMTMPAPHMLAIAREGDAFAIASVDAIGQLQIVRATNTAEVTRRLDVGLARPVVALHATPVGFITLRDDRVVTILDVDGTIRADLASEPGEYIASLAVRGDRALALIESDEKVRGRWIDLPTGRWGATTVELPFRDGNDVVLSPSYERVAGRREKGDVIATVALETGKIVETFRDMGSNARAAGFSTERKLVVADDRQAWIPKDEESDPFRSKVIAFANGMMFLGVESTIALRSPESVSYVGYRMLQMTQVIATKSGFLVTDSGSIVELDRSFKTRTAFSPMDTPQQIGQLRLVDGGRAIGFTFGENRSLYLISTGKVPANTLVASRVNTFEYEPASGLLHYQSEGIDYIARFDPKNGFGGAVPVLEYAPSERIVLLDPALANGDEIAIIKPDANSNYTVRWGTVASEFVQRSEQTIIPSEDWREMSGDVVELVRSQRRRATSPDGSLSAEIRDQRVIVREGKKERWRVPANGATNLLWTPNGELVLFGAGLASVDLATGALRDRQCGAWFGRWEFRPDVGGSTSLCEVM